MFKRRGKLSKAITYTLFIINLTHRATMVMCESFELLGIDWVTCLCGGGFAIIQRWKKNPEKNCLPRSSHGIVMAAVWSIQAYSYNAKYNNVFISVHLRQIRSIYKSLLVLISCIQFKRTSPEWHKRDSDLNAIKMFFKWKWTSNFIFRADKQIVTLYRHPFGVQRSGTGNWNKGPLSYKGMRRGGKEAEREGGGDLHFGLRMQNQWEWLYT